METQPVIDKIRQALKENVDDKTLATGQNYFKEEVKLHGVKIPTLNKISKEYYEIIQKESKETIFHLCDLLWQSGYLEEGVIACNLSYYLHTAYTPEDLKTFERWIDLYVTNWATCDTLCNHTIGTFIEMYPEYVAELKTWSHSENRWKKRAAAVTLIIPARKGMFLPDIFQIADTLLPDKDDLVQKGYGWMLKAASEAHRQEVYEYVLERRATMPRTALRYAIEKMPKEMKTEAMKKI